ncbi:hypothetical protein, partial [Fibrobacter sp.]|uniref:hypothetical protein n=1 Tax=Fibrobacter sp. TaxID=35828 RepID=UPI00388E4737
MLLYSAPMTPVRHLQTQKNKLMKKIILLIALAAVSLAAAGCTSLRTPSEGSYAGKVFYNTFMGLSLESMVYGDGLVPHWSRRMQTKSA